MAGERWGRALFPGISQVQSCEYTLSHGVLPGTAVLTCAPQANFPAIGGDLVIFDGIGEIILRGCKIDKHEIVTTERGRIWQLSILDRRWKWQFGHISGLYNARDANSQLINRTAKSPRDLAYLCLRAMGEALFDVTDLTDDAKARPLTNWDYTNPAAALEELAEKYGCRVVWNPISDTVSLKRAGVGDAMPAGPIHLDSTAIDPPERPDTIKLVCGPSRINTWIALEAVGLDKDGLTKPLDKLSYAPTVAPGEFPFAHTPPDEFYALADLDARRLAKETLFLWYRITPRHPAHPSDPSKKLFVPGIGFVDRYEQLLPLEDTLAESVIQLPVTEGGPEGSHTPVPARVAGFFYNGLGNVIADPIDTVYDRGFSIDRENGIVKFSERMLILKEEMVSGQKTVKILPAVLFLFTGVVMRDGITNGLLRHEVIWSFPPPLSGTPAKVVRKDELRLAVLPEFTSERDLLTDPAGQIVFGSNQIEIDELARFYLEGEAAKFQQTFPQTVTYGGIHPFAPDGAIQQITWQVGNRQPCTTRVSRNTEHQHFLLDWRERRQMVNRRIEYPITQLTALANGNNPSMTASSGGQSVLVTR